MEEQLNKIEEFFNLDLEIKNILFDIAPEEVDSYNEESRMNYVDRLIKELRYIKDMLEKVEVNFHISSKENFLTNFFERLKDKIYNFNYKNGNIQMLYEQIISNMDEKLVSEVSETCVGHLLLNSPEKIADSCKTINELLHVYHSHIINDNENYKKLPVLGEPKKSEHGYTVTLYGNDTALGKKIFEEFPMDMNCGDVDIMSLKERILMMIRDKGHALSIEVVEKKDNTISVNYFIPKICNVDMVNQLRGVTKVKEESKFTRGMFDTKNEEITSQLFEFIRGVPTDDDMINIYEESNEIYTEGENFFEEMQESEKDVEKQEDYGINKESILELSKTRKVSRIRKMFEMIKNKYKGRTNDERTKDE